MKISEIRGRFLFARSRELHGAIDSLPFFHVNQLIRFDVFQRVDLAAGPPNFEQIDFRCFADSKVDPKIILRKVTAAAADFVDLSNAVLLRPGQRHTPQPRANTAPI